MTQVGLEELDADVLPQAILRASPEGIGQAGGITFSHYADDLDGFDAAVVRIEGDGDGPSGSRSLGLVSTGFHHGMPSATALLMQSPVQAPPLIVMIHRYDREPHNQVTLYLPGKLASKAATRAAIHRVLRAFNLGPDAVAWERADGPTL